MVQKVQTILEDDLDGGPADETVTFALDGVSYEIDLNSDHASEMRDAFAPYVGNGRPPDSGKPLSTGRRPRAVTEGRGGDNNSAEIRAWARETGHKVNERGRLPKEVLEAYRMAH